MLPCVLCLRRRVGPCQLGCWRSCAGSWLAGCQLSFLVHVPCAPPLAPLHPSYSLSWVLCVVRQFGKSQCSSPTANCAGSLLASPTSTSQALGQRSDTEVMLLSSTGNYLIFSVRGCYAALRRAGTSV